MIAFFSWLNGIYKSLDSLPLVILMFMGYVVAGWIIAICLIVVFSRLADFLSDLFHRNL
jgi:hypothetical protein